MTGGVPESGYSCTSANPAASPPSARNRACSDCSIGSNGSGSLAKKAHFHAGNAGSASSVSTRSIRLSVSVPVLSTASTVADPRVSTVAGVRAMMPWRSMRYAPSARKVDSATGTSSGSTDMARVSPCNSPCSTLPDSHA